MGEFFIFIVKSSICVAAFFLFYKLLLSKETFHRLNRILLLLLVLISIVIPFIKIELNTGIKPSIVLTEAVYNFDYSVADIPVQKTESWVLTLLLIYICGVIISAAYQTYSLVSMLRLFSKSSERIHKCNTTIYLFDYAISPFSWMNNIVISREDYFADGKEIITHEMEHIRLRHSADLLLMQLAMVFQWFNPAIYLIKRELQAIHEFEADEAVINKGIDAKKYQLLLIKKAVGSRLYSAANSFNHSKLKKRITMMVKEKSPKRTAFKALFVLPLTLLAIAAFASEKVQTKVEAVSKAEFSDFIQKDTTKKEKIVVVVNESKSTDPKSKSSTHTIKFNSSDKGFFMIDGKKVSIDSVQNVNGKKIINYVSEDGKKMKIIMMDADKDEKIVKTEVIAITEGVEQNEKIEKSETIQVKLISNDSKVDGADTTKKIIVYNTNKDGSKTAVSPLVIFDGKEISEKELKAIDRNQIDNITILKGEAAIKLYQEKGKDGVIIITSKKKN